MIDIIVPHLGKRIEYTTHLLFSEIYGLPFRIVPISEFVPNPLHFTINYTGDIIEANIHIPNMGLLGESSIRPNFPQVGSPFLDAWRIAPFDPSGNIFSFDIFSAIFWLVSDYEKYQYNYKDTHDRYDAARYPSEIWGLTQSPTVALYADELIRLFPIVLQARIRRNRQQKTYITWDIDHAWKYRNKSFWVTAGGMTQAILKGKGKEIYQRYKAVVYRQDEYDTFNEIFSICPPDQTTFFFLIDSHSPEDARFSYRTPALRHLIRTIADKGYEVGLHPSYTSYQNQLRLAFEKKALSEILGKEITRSRQHFLRYTLPTTFQYLAEIGIMDEYSYGFTHQVGFPCGMMKSYNHYDLSTESISPIRIHPFLMMDRSLQKYISGTKSEKMARVREVWNWTKKLGGEFRILLHNDVLSNSPEWDGWGDEIRNIIAYSTMP